MPGSIDVWVAGKDDEVRAARLPVSRVICAGYAGRNQAKVREHIEELERLGVRPPAEIPTLYVVAPNQVTTGESIEVACPDTSGEVEFVLYGAGDDVLVGVGSDHTDRELEKIDVAKSKQVCPKVVSPRFWRMGDLLDHWDAIALRSRIGANAETLYQEDSLAALMAPADLMRCVESRIGFREGDLLFSGTVPALHGLVSSEFFEMEMCDPVLKRSLRHRYRVVVIG